METSEKKKPNDTLRVALNDKGKEIVEGWKRSLEENFPGIKISYTELIGWAAEKIGGELSKRDQALIRERFFDEVKQLEWLLAKAKTAKTMGEKFELPSMVIPSQSKGNALKKDPLPIEEKENSSNYE